MGSILGFKAQITFFCNKLQKLYRFLEEIPSTLMRDYKHIFIRTAVFSCVISSSALELQRAAWQQLLQKQTKKWGTDRSSGINGKNHIQPGKKL